jgi:hypothetical protein
MAIALSRQAAAVKVFLIGKQKREGRIDEEINRLA